LRKILNTIFFALILVVSFSSDTQAAGDYVWEGKFKEALPKAEQGDAKSQYTVGEMYEKGKGAVKDSKKAFEWYSKSAQQNNKKAAYKVGLAYLEGYENGQGVKQNFSEAQKWYKRALAGGYGIASEGISRVSRAQRASENARVAKKPKSAPKPKAARKPKAAPKPKTTKGKVLAGGWKKGNKSAEYLPSSLTQCKDKGSRIECLSAGVKRNIGMADINYTTKAIILGFKPTGAFKVSYRNNVSKISITDPEFAESGRKVPVTLGWQDAEHKLTCDFENDRSLECTKNKTRKVKFRR